MATNPLVVLCKTPPKHCGKKYFHRQVDYLAWKILRSKLYLFNPVIEVPEVVHTPTIIDISHRKPRKGEGVMQDGKFLGTIIYLSEGEVFLHDGSSYGDDLFVCKRSRGHSTVWLLD